nr:zinc finger, CCHC-type [Tanacetum cinerariifolium]
VRKLLDSTPDRFIQIVASIEQTSDLDDITLDEIIGKLKAFEERIKLWKGGQVESQENLLFAQGEHSGKGRRFSKCGEEDDEPSLLMTTHETEHEEVLLNEGQIQPGKYASGDASMWYLDNGASNHMTGTKSHFKDIDESVSGRVRFGDGSYVQIKGRGSILLGCRDQEQKIVSDVYYIPNLKSNILSLGQLTEIDQALSTFKEFRQQIEMEKRMKLRMLRTDRGGEFTSNEFTKYFKENGIAQQLTAPYSPQQNGVVERRNRIVLSTTR